MHCYRPSTKHIKDVEHKLFQDNQIPTFTNVPSIRNYKDDSTAPNDSASIVSNDTTSNTLYQDITTITADKDLNRVSPKRAKLRQESHKHVTKQVNHVIRRANLKQVSININDIV